MKKLILITLFLNFLMFLQVLSKSEVANLNGYIQTRFTTDYQENAGFSVRRAKVWLKGQTPFDNHFGYKIQGLYKTGNAHMLLLQDAYASYTWSWGLVKAGLFVPAFSLQRSQFDPTIPSLERAMIINTMIPGAETLARELGVETQITSKDSPFMTTLGVFDSKGIDFKFNEGRNFLITNRTYYELELSDLIFHLGYSLSYRNVNNLTFNKIFGNDSAFKGTDFRWDIESRIYNDNFSIQAEYLQADLCGNIAKGYYALTDYTINKKHQIVLYFDKFQDLNKNTNDNPWYGIGYNYIINGIRAKILTETKLQFVDNKTNVQSIIQFTLFLK